MSDPTITCPSCKTEIKLNESLAAPLIEATRKQFEQKLSQKDAEILKREENLNAKEKQILDLENEIKKNNIQAPKKIMQEKKVINYTFNVNLYRKINDNDNGKKNHPRLGVDNEIDGEGNMYLIDKY